MQSKFRFVRFCLSTLISVALCSSRCSASDDNTYSWQPVQQNMRVRDGDYQIGISNEGACKTRCVADQDCIGVDWDAGRKSCFLLLDSGASPYTANGYRHWRIIRSRSTPAINQDNTYSWQPVQQNMRLRNGDYKIGISNEEVCKTRCVADQDCIGVDWDAGRRSCFLLSDSDTSPYSANGYSHWRITRNRSPDISSQATPTRTTSAVNTDAVIDVTKQESNKATPTRTTTVGSYTSAVNTDAVIDVTKQESNKGDFYTWQSVQLDTRVKVGEHRQDLQSEIACKDHCLRSSSCAGVYWYNLSSICMFHTDCRYTPYPQSGCRYWRIQKYSPTPSTCQNLIIRDVQQVGELLMKGDLQQSSSAFSALGVILGVSTVVIIALLINTCRLNRKIQKLASPRDDGQLAQRVQEQRHECNNSYQPAAYMEMIGTETEPRTSVGDNVYEVLDDNPHPY